MIDITLDLETTSLAPTAGVLSIAAVPWKRNGGTTPFFEDKELSEPEFSAHVDLRSMFVNGFSFDQQTAKWWDQQADAAKAAVLADDDEARPCAPIDVVVQGLFDWIDRTMKELNETQVCVWAQGSDFDPAILRNICYKFGIKFPIKHCNLRDHRTFFLESAGFIWSYISDNDLPTCEAYKMVQDYKEVAEDEGQTQHCPLFDCKRSIYSTWQMFDILGDFVGSYDKAEFVSNLAKRSGIQVSSPLKEWLGDSQDAQSSQEKKDIAHIDN